MIDNLLLALFALILCAKLIGSLLEKMGLDSSIGELLTGIILGPSLLDLVPPETIEPFALIGSVLILFIAGMKEENIEEILKDKISRKIGLSLLFVTAGIMTAFFYSVPVLFGVSFTFLQAVILAIAFSIIDLGVPAKIMISKNLISLPVGKITIRSAVINLVVGLLLFTLTSLMISFNLAQLLRTIFEIAIFVVIILFLMFFLSKIANYILKIHIEEAEFSLAILLILFLAYLTETIGFSSVLGAFVAGQLIGRTPFAETRSFSDKVKSISFGLFIPLFFVWFGLTIKIGEIFAYIWLALLIFVLYIAIRFGITYLFMKHYKYDMPEIVSSSMLSVDVESLIVLMIALRMGIFTDNIPLMLFAPSVFFSTLLIVVLVSVFSKKKARLS